MLITITDLATTVHIFTYLHFLDIRKNINKLVLHCQQISVVRKFVSQNISEVFAKICVAILAVSKSLNLGIIIDTSQE